MNHGQIVFSQIMDYFPRRRFKSCVDRYRGDHRIRTFSCLDQFYCMAFAQLTGRESLRDIEACLRAAGPKLYHAGMKASMYEILQVLGVMLFEKTPIKSLFSADFSNFSKSHLHNQLLLFDLYEYGNGSE